jgi:hypothetical protein
MDLFAIASWAWKNRDDIELLQSKTKPVFDLVQAEKLVPVAQRLFASFPTDPPPQRTVTWVQQALNRAGFSVAVDGAYGQMTRTAVEEFQRAHALVTDGWVGPATAAVLESYLPG